MTGNSSSLLDLIITDSPGYIINTEVNEPLGDPYHCRISCSVKVDYKKPSAFPRTIWKYNLADYQKLNDELIEAPWATMNIFPEIDDAAHYFETLFLNICKTHIPVKNITVRPKDKPWITNNLKRLFRKRGRAYNFFKKHQSDESLQNYRTIKQQVIQAKNEAKHSYYLKLSNKLTNPATGPKEYWHLTKELCGTKVKTGIPPLIKDDVVYPSPESKCKLFNEHFSEKSKLPPNTPPLPEFQYLTDSRLNFMQFNESDVLKVLKNLNTAKANGPDGISNTLLKNTAESIAPPLCQLFNRSLATGQFPNNWKKANVSPVFKKNDRQDVRNYRPISLLPNIGKVLERLVFTKLYTYCKENNLLTWRNSGYKPFDSTVNQLIFLTHKIYEALEKGNDVCFVSLDASAAFDRVWHKGLIFKLKRFGICGIFLEWIKDYLKNRKQRVVIDGFIGEWINILCGVPQGSILGPLLFLIYIDDIIEDIKCEILLFADDTSLLEPITDPTLSIAKVNSDLNVLSAWAAQWLVMFNPTKTKYIIFSKKYERPQYGNLFLENKQIEKVEHHKQLGIIFNSRLTWEEHVTEKCEDAGKRLSVIKRLPETISPYTKLHIYTSFVRPVLEYGSSLFDNLSCEQSQQLEGIQRQAAISITRAYSHTSNERLLSELGLTSLKTRRTKAKLNLFHKIYHGQAPDYLKSLIPKKVAPQNQYNLRQPQNIHLPKITKNYFLKSFIPSTIRLWNNLPSHMKEITEVETFKNHVNEYFHDMKFYKPYLTGKSEGHIHLSRIRMGLSGLNAHRKKYHFIENSICPNCHFNHENEIHFFLHCANYAVQRMVMMTQLQALFPNKNPQFWVPTTKKQEEDIVLLITKGCGN